MDFGQSEICAELDEFTALITYVFHALVTLTRTTRKRRTCTQYLCQL